MSMNRAQVDAGGNFVRQQIAGDSLLDQTQVASITTAGAGTLTAAAMLSGCIDRTGPAGGYADTLDSADNLLAASPLLSGGDSFEFTYRNTVAFAQTLSVGEGAELSGSNTGISASSVRRYLVTVIAAARRQIYSVSMTNASPTLTGLTQAQAQTLIPLMGVTAASGVPAATTLLAVNSVAGTVTMSANATVTQTIACTFFPRYNIKGLFQASL